MDKTIKRTITLTIKQKNYVQPLLSPGQQNQFKLTTKRGGENNPKKMMISNTMVKEKNIKVMIEKEMLTLALQKQ